MTSFQKKSDEAYANQMKSVLHLLDDDKAKEEYSIKISKDLFGSNKDRKRPLRCVKRASRREIKMKKNNQPKYQKKSVIYIPTQLGSRRLRLYSKRLVLISMSFVLDLGRHALSRLISIVTIMMLLSCMCQHLSQS